MKFKPTIMLEPGANRWRRGFTLAEALAALAFLALVIPVAVEGLRVANLAGEVAMRKTVAARIADREMNEILATKQYQQSSASGSVEEEGRLYQWQLTSTAWNLAQLRLLTMRVVYAIQGRDYEVHLTTLVDTSTQ